MKILQYLQSLQSMEVSDAMHGVAQLRRKGSQHRRHAVSALYTPRTIAAGFVKQGGMFVAAMGLLTLSYSALAAPPASDASQSASTQQRLKTDVQLRDILTMPDKVMGRKVTVEGIVTNVYSNRMFTVRAKGTAKSGRVPILATAPIPGQYGRSDADPIRVGDSVQVTGTVTRFEVAEMQKTTGKQWVERDYRVFVSKPALLATMAVVVPGGSSAAQGASIPSNGSQEASAGSSAAPPPWRNVHGFTTFTDFPAPSDWATLVGKAVKLQTVSVLSVISDRGFYVGDATDKRLFCVLDHALDDGKMEKIVVVKKGQTLMLEGTIEKMPTEQNALKRWTVDEQEAAQLAKQAVYLHVRSIRFK